MDLNVSKSGMIEPNELRFILKHWGNLKFREIAEQIGENINTVQGRFRYGIKKLKEMLKQQQIEITT